MMEGAGGGEGGRAGVPIVGVPDYENCGSHWCEGKAGHPQGSEHVRPRGNGRNTDEVQSDDVAQIEAAKALIGVPESATHHAVLV